MRSVLIPLLAAAALAGCSSRADREASVKPGMSTEQVFQAVGKPESVIATFRDKKGHSIQVYEFYIESITGSSSARYWYVFTDGKFTESRPATSDWNAVHKELRDGEGA